jgi:ACS family hexuronate transporter-like MFS transporter
VHRLKRRREGAPEDKGREPVIRGLRWWVAWTGGFGFSLLVGALADTLGYGPLFGLLGVFDLVGAAALIVLIGGERRAARFAAA